MSLQKVSAEGLKKVAQQERTHGSKRREEQAGQGRKFWFKISSPGVIAIGL
jgi:hypothetical protein